MTDLFTETLALLRADARKIEEIAQGASVNKHWLAKFKQGRFGDAGARKLQRLHNFLRQPQKQ